MNWGSVSRTILWCVAFRRDTPCEGYRAEKGPLTRFRFFFVGDVHVQGGGFIAYGVILAILLLVGEAWTRKSGRSPDWWDSCVILVWVRTLAVLLCTIS